MKAWLGAAMWGKVCQFLILNNINFMGEKRKEKTQDDRLGALLWQIHTTGWLRNHRTNPTLAETILLQMKRGKKKKKAEHRPYLTLLTATCQQTARF